MKKTTSTRAVFALACTAAAAILAVTACTNPVLGALNAMTQTTFGLTGTWKNTDPVYAIESQPPKAYLLTMSSDGTFSASSSGVFAVPTPGTYTIDSATTVGDTRTFTIHFQWYAGTAHCYALVRVTAPATFEINGFGMPPYPTSISPTDSMTYSKYAPQ